MKFFCRVLTVCVLLGLRAADAPAQEKVPPPAASPAPKTPEPEAAKVTLAYRAKVGQVTRSKSEGTLHFEANGAKMTLEVKETDKLTFTAVAPGGDITFERENESQEMTFNGQKMPSEAPKDTKETITLRANGTLVAYKVAEDNKEQGKLSVRLHVASAPVFPQTPVGVGDTWSHEYKADADLGTEAGKADFELVAWEKIGGVDAAKIKMRFGEAGTSPAITGSGFVWVEKTSGDAVVTEYEIDNVPFGSGEQRVVLAGKVRDERIEGSPLGDAKTANTNAKEKTIDEVVKDFEKLPGVLTLFRKKEAGKDTIYAELREGQLDTLMMLQATASTGTSQQIVAGDPINDLVFKFVRSGDDKILFVTPNIGFRVSDNKPIARAVRRSFADAFLESYKIEAQQPERKSVLINISDLFRGDIAQISAYFSGAPLFPGMPGGNGYNLDKEKTYVVKVANFPENLVVETQYHFSKSGARGLMDAMGGGSLADTRSAPLRVSYNLSVLPANGYKPRLADGRVGYFVTEHQSFDNDGLDDMMVRYILRWNLEKADPLAKQSPPKKPIVFWLDNAIPVEYRAAVKDGILLWNKAFARVGITDAIVVNQMPDDAAWDHADGRYNTIRWVASPASGYAVALFRTNPLTGQILNANITVDANLVRALKMERKHLIEPAAAFEAGAGLDPVEAALKAGAGKPAKALLAQHRCEMAGEKMDQAWFGHLAASLLGPRDGKNPLGERDFINAFLREVVAHEMGHILGLRHNFVASTESDLVQLKNADRVKKLGITASVMDYNPTNLAAIKTRGVDFFSQTVGTYDLWAIEYGYTPIPAATTPEAELGQLKQIARKSNLPGHAYQSDEIADQFDPRVSRFDLGSDPLLYWTRMLQTSRYLLVTLDKRLPKPGESYWEFTKAFNRLLGTYARAAGTASRYVGGLHVNRNYKGDVGEKPTLVPVPVAKQKQALALLNTYIFSPTAFTFPERYYTHLTANPQMGFADWLGGAPQDFPVRDQIAGIQRSALKRLLAPPTLTRIANNEFKLGGDAARALTMPYLLQSVGSSVWAELEAKPRAADAKRTGPTIPALRRQLQRTHLELLIDLFVKPAPGTPEDAKMLAWDQLRQLKTRIIAQRSANMGDDYTRVHLDESLTRINRTLDAKVLIGAPAPAGPANLLQMLLGGDAQGSPSKP